MFFLDDFDDEPREPRLIERLNDGFAQLTDNDPDDPPLQGRPPQPIDPRENGRIRRQREFR